VSVRDEADQAVFVVEEVLARREAGIALKAQAVLFRASHHSATLEIELTRRNIPFVKFGGLNSSKRRTSRTCSRRCAGSRTRATASPASACCS